MADADITLGDVVIHMQAMEQRLSGRIDNVENRLTVRMDGLDRRMDGMEQRLNRKIDRVEIRLSVQINAIDKRLDAIEIENLPKRVTVLEAARR